VAIAVAMDYSQRVQAINGNFDFRRSGISQDFRHFIKGAVNSQYLILPKDDETFFIGVVDEADELDELSIH
jgi:hypothetical protein